MIKKYFCLLLILFISACSSTESLPKDAPPIAGSIAFNLLPGTWKFSRITFTAMTEQVSEKDKAGFIKKMTSSSTISFHDDYRYSANIMGQTESGKWEIDATTNTLLILKEIPSKIKILHLDAATMKGNFSDDEGTQGYMEFVRVK